MKNFCFAFALALCAFSCKKERQEVQLASPSAESESAKVQAESAFQKVSKSVLIVFGHSFNDGEFVKKNVESLSNAFGAADNGGFVSQAVFPDDFVENGRARLSKIGSLLKNGEHCALISLGAPEGFFAALDDAQEDFSNFKTISLFPQDDALSAESVSFAVLSQDMDFEKMEQELAVSEECASHILQECVAFLRDDFLGKIPQKEWKMQSLHELVQKLVGNQGSISPFFDANTGIPSANHFVIQVQKSAK